MIRPEVLSHMQRTEVDPIIKITEANKLERVRLQNKIMNRRTIYDASKVHLCFFNNLGDLDNELHFNVLQT